MSNKVRMKDIAEKVGVSIVSVSKAINGKDGVSEDVRNQILTVAKDLGYETNFGEKKSEHTIIGILIVDGFLSDKNTFYGNIHNAIVRYASEMNISVLFEIVSPTDETNNNMPKILQNKQVQGIIYLGAFMEEYTNHINKENIPYVFLDFYNDNKEANSVLSDSYNGSEEITKLLIYKGHKNIRFVGTINLVSSITDRYLGYLKALIDNNMLETSNITPIEDRSGIGKGFKTFEIDSMPEAFVCANDETAFYLINYLKEQNIRIPEDVSVVGFDDSYFADVSNPQLTTYKVDIETMAIITVRQLIQIIQGKNTKPVKTIVHGEIIERDSVKER